MLSYLGDRTGGGSLIPIVAGFIVALTGDVRGLFISLIGAVAATATWFLAGYGIRLSRARQD